MSAFDTDFADAHGLWSLHNLVLQLEEGISDTEMTAGSVATLWVARLPSGARVLQVRQDGGSVRNEVSADIPGAKAVYEELKTRFPQTGTQAPRGWNLAAAPCGNNSVWRGITGVQSAVISIPNRIISAPR